MHGLRRRSEAGAKDRLVLEEYSHFGLLARFMAGSAGLPFWPLDDYAGSSIPGVNPAIKSVRCPYTVAFASKRVIVVAEQIVGADVIRRDPNRTLVPGILVRHVVHEPWGCHPSFVQGHYDRDNDFYVRWEEISRDPERYADWLDAFVFGVPDRAAYMAKLGAGVMDRLRAKPRMAEGASPHGATRSRSVAP